MRNIRSFFKQLFKQTKMLTNANEIQFDEKKTN